MNHPLGEVGYPLISNNTCVVLGGGGGPESLEDVMVHWFVFSYCWGDGKDYSYQWKEMSSKVGVV